MSFLALILMKVCVMNIQSHQTFKNWYLKLMFDAWFVKYVSLFWEKVHFYLYPDTLLHSL